MKSPMDTAKEIVAKRTHWFTDEDGLRRTRVACDPDELMFTIAELIEAERSVLAEKEARIKELEISVKGVQEGGRNIQEAMEAKILAQAQVIGRMREKLKGLHNYCLGIYSPNKKEILDLIEKALPAESSEGEGQ